MYKSEIEAVLIDALNTIQSLGGHPPVALHSGTCPLTDLAGFDSILAVEATVMISQQLGIEAPLNLFAPAPNNDSLPISHVVDVLSTLIARDPGGTSYGE